MLYAEYYAAYTKRFTHTEAEQAKADVKRWADEMRTALPHEIARVD